jgi:predicted TIM-barrel fold metal-dependent hydrolase
MTKRPISADSHVTEPPNCFIDHIEPAFRDRAPRLTRDPQRGDIYVVPGMTSTIPVSLSSGAGRPAEELSTIGARFEELHRGGWDAKARLADQDRDGVAAELVYPSVGMVLCNHEDLDYKRACMQAYNRWLEGFCADAPGRVFGLGQTAVRTVEEGIEDLRAIKAVGFKGAMLPGCPGQEDYDSRIYDPFWEAAVDLGLPLSFHILTSKTDGLGKPRGPKINAFLSIIRGNQDILGMLVFSGVFQRHPKLKVVCVEADAGWAPHYMYRMDHAYKRHRHWLKGRELEKLPSDYFRENIYLTFQDDWTAFQFAHQINHERLMWASDFPHSDSTWPDSQKVIAEQTSHLSADVRDRILHDNVADLYGISVQ